MNSRGKSMILQISETRKTEVYLLLYYWVITKVQSKLQCPYTREIELLGTNITENTCLVSNSSIFVELNGQSLL